MAAMDALPGFMALMLLSGSCNTIFMKFMVMQKVPTGPGAPATGFNHPYFQSLLMMIGEFLCLIAYFATRERGQEKNIVQQKSAPKLIFLVACLFDWTATTLVNMAYGFIAASIVQMTRGAIVIFTCLLSVVFLGRRQQTYHKVGVFLVFAGITLVSMSVFINPDVHPVVGDAKEAAAAAKLAEATMHGKVMGIALCICAQIFQASMIVYEEKIMSQYVTAPLQVVGMEGSWGIGVGVILLAILNPLGYENTPGAVYQMQHSRPLMFAVVASIFSIALFNYAGVTVTKQASAVARSTIDVSRTIVIWAVELALGWNSFNMIQLTGFVILALGTLIYNHILVVPALEPGKEKNHLEDGL